jgi:hypothetical protein
MALQRRRRSYSIASRIRVPSDLRPHIGRRDVVKSLKTTDSSAARLKGAQWEGHAALFARLRQNSAMMNPEQIDALVSQYLDAELHEVEQQLATNARKVNDHGEHGDWNDVAQSLLADEIEKAEEVQLGCQQQSLLPPFFFCPRDLRGHRGDRNWNPRLPLRPPKGKIR